MLKNIPGLPETGPFEHELGEAWRRAELEQAAMDAEVAQGYLRIARLLLSFIDKADSVIALAKAETSSPCRH
jgi:hypothetical protein